MDPIDKLRDFLQGRPKGEITGPDKEKVVNLLSEGWHLLDGCHMYKMHPGKVMRAVEEAVRFEPPHMLFFCVERHGSMAFGSVYADLQEWAVDLLAKTTIGYDTYQKRLVGKRDKPLKVEPLAQEVLNDILSNNQSSKKVTWKDENGVRVEINEVIPATNKQTTSARRKRFRAKLEELLEPHGWYRGPVRNTYVKPPDNS